MKGSAYNQKSNNIMRGSARRSRLGLDVSNWNFPNLGNIEMVGYTAETPIPGVVQSLASGGAKISHFDNVAPAHPVRYLGTSHQNQLAPPQKEKKEIEIVPTEKLELASGNTAALSSISDVLGTNKLSDDNRWKLLRRSKQLLAMRTVTPELALRLDLRRDWNLHRKVVTLLDCFPSLKHSYSSLRGKKLDGAVSILSNGQSARIDDIARSHSIRLDPVDSPKELYRYRQRIQRIIAWAYANDLVPVMMTLTVYHRWNDLAPLCRVLRGAWSDLFRGPAGMKRKDYIGLCGYIRRMEETFNDGDSDFNESLNSGWHPHYHVILFVPRDRVSSLSNYESELRQVWVKLVRKHYLKEFGEDIPAAFLPSFELHGLFFSRFKSAAHARKGGCSHARGGDLVEVKDGKYLAKVMGIDTPLYGGDSELTSWAKFSKTPFDLLKCKVTANLSDLWCEYAIATKKIPCFTFSKGLNKEVDAYFESLSGSAAASSVVLPTEGLVVSLKPEDYHWLYRHFLIGELLDKASQGYAVAKAWLKDSFGIEVVEDAPPTAVSVLQDESKVAPFEESSKAVGNFKRLKKLSVTNFQSAESLPLICHNVTLQVLDCNSPQVLPVNCETLFNYDNKAPP